MAVAGTFVPAEAIPGQTRPGWPDTTLHTDVTAHDMTPVPFTVNGGLDVTAQLAAPALTTLRFPNTGTEILFVAAGAAAETVTVDIGATVLGQPVHNFQLVSLASGHTVAFGPFSAVADMPGGDIQVTLSTTASIQVGLLQFRFVTY